MDVSFKAFNCATIQIATEARYPVKGLGRIYQGRKNTVLWRSQGKTRTGSHREWDGREGDTMRDERLFVNPPGNFPLKLFGLT